MSTNSQFGPKGWTPERLGSLDGKTFVITGANAGAGRTVPTALPPGEDGTARFGLMAAGSKSGSSYTMVGTSFSTALATRRIALDLLAWVSAGRSDPEPGTEAWMTDKAQTEDAAANYPGKTKRRKAGGGRMDGVDTGRIAR